MAYPYFPLSSAQVGKRSVAWCGLADRSAFGRAAVVLLGAPPDAADIARDLPPAEEIPLKKTGKCNPEWAGWLRGQLRAMQINALTGYGDDYYPAISTPRSLHAQTQGLAEAFGCRLLEQANEPGLFYPVPSVSGPQEVYHLKPKLVQESLYQNAIDYAVFAREVTDGQLAVRCPVMTGPIDTANYILGSMTLLEWIYDEPAALHKLLEMITDFLIALILSLQQATGGSLAPDHSFCLERGFNFCSEMRSIISAEAFEEFEAPYLLKIGQACGPFMIHSCGTWERALPATMDNPYIMMAHFQCREMDIRKVSEITMGGLSCNIGRSINLGERYTWPDSGSFFRHLIGGIAQPMPLEVDLGVNDLEAFIAAQRELNGGPSGMFRWRI